MPETKSKNLKKTSRKKSVSTGSTSGGTPWSKSSVRQEQNLEKTERLKIILKDKLEKEQKLTDYNRTKLMTKWREIMRQEKSEDLKKETKVMQESFERIIERKNEMVVMLKNRLIEDEQIYEKTIATQYEDVDRLLEIQADRVETLRKNFESLMESTKNEIQKEIDSTSSQQNIEMIILLKELKAIEQGYEDRLSRSVEELDASVNQIKSKNMEEIQGTLMHQEVVVEDLSRLLTAANIDFEARTSQLRQSYEKLQVKDKKDKEEIQMQQHEIHKLTEAIDKMRATISEESKCHNRLKSSSLLESLKEQNICLKSKLNTEEKNFKENLKRFVVEWEEILTKLTENRDTLEKILKISELCERLEYADDKNACKEIMVQDKKYDKVDERNLVARASAVEGPLDLFQKSWKGCQLMENFWIPFNKVILDIFRLEEEKKKLSERNEEMEIKLKKAQNTINFGLEVLLEKPPLSVECYKESFK